MVSNQAHANERYYPKDFFDPNLAKANNAAYEAYMKSVAGGQEAKPAAKAEGAKKEPAKKEETKKAEPKKAEAPKQAAVQSKKVAEPAEKKEGS